MYEYMFLTFKEEQWNPTVGSTAASFNRETSVSQR